MLYKLVINSVKALHTAAYIKNKTKEVICHIYSMQLQTDVKSDSAVKKCLAPKYAEDVSGSLCYLQMTIPLLDDFNQLNSLLDDFYPIAELYRMTFHLAEFSTE